MSGLVKPKKYDWKDSNLALFGSDLEKQVRNEDGLRRVRLRRSTVFARSANHERSKAKTMRHYCEVQIHRNSKLSVDTCLRKSACLASLPHGILGITCVHFVILPPRDQYNIDIDCLRVGNVSSSLLQIMQSLPPRSYLAQGLKSTQSCQLLSISRS